MEVQWETGGIFLFSQENFREFLSSIMVDFGMIEDKKQHQENG